MQYYRIANLTVSMDTFGRTAAQAAPYLTEKPTGDPDIHIESCTPALRQAMPSLTEEDCEYMATGSSFYRQLLRFDGMLLHASAVVVDGRTYLFSAPSGTGKSTHTQLWLQRFGARAQILNDDKPALRCEDGIWYAYGTPWSGKNDSSCNMRAPLAGICILRRGAENRIVPYQGIGALHDILEQTVRMNDPEYIHKLLTLLDRLLTQVSLWRLECNQDPDAALLSYRAMAGQGKEG